MNGKRFFLDKQIKVFNRWYSIIDTKETRLKSRTVDRSSAHCKHTSSYY